MVLRSLATILIMIALSMILILLIPLMLWRIFDLSDVAGFLVCMGGVIASWAVGMPLLVRLNRWADEAS